MREENTHAHTRGHTHTLTTLNDICLRSGTARRKQRLCARADLKRAHRQTHATASVLSGRAGLTPVAMETELRSKRQPAAEDGRVAVTGLTSWEKKKVIFLFFYYFFFLLGREPNEENKRRTSVAAGSGSSNPHTSAANAGGDGRMCATCEEFVVFTRCSALIAPRAHFSCSAAAFVAAEVS